MPLETEEQWARYKVPPGRDELGILLSYAKHGGRNQEKFLKQIKTTGLKVMLDSGAFSAWQSGEEISITHLAEFYRFWQKNHPQVVCINLDSIYDARRTWENQLFLESCGLNILPVFHIGSDYRELDRLCDLYDYILLGGIVPYLKQSHRAALMAFCKKCHDVSDGRARFHALGCGQPSVLLAFPWKSSDNQLGSSVYSHKLSYWDEPALRMRSLNISTQKKDDLLRNERLCRKLFGVGFGTLCRRVPNSKQYSVAYHNQMRLQYGQYRRMVVTLRDRADHDDFTLYSVTWGASDTRELVLSATYPTGWQPVPTRFDKK